MNNIYSSAHLGALEQGLLTDVHREAEVHSSRQDQT